MSDPTSWVDVFGLDYFYQLIKEGKVVYCGITKNEIKQRISAHVNSAEKDFTEFRYLEVDDRIASRDLEGSSLAQAERGALQNKTRKDQKYYHSYDKNNLPKGRTYYEQNEIDKMMSRAQKGKIKDRKVILSCPQ